MTTPTALVHAGVGTHPVRWRRFVDPVELAVATTPADVLAVVRRAERWASEGRWVVGTLAYEAASAFDPGLRTHPGGPVPLAWFAAFARAQECQAPTVSGDVAVGPWGGLDAVAHARAVATITERIAAGDTYQVNHTVRLRAPFDGDPADLFALLTAAQPTDFTAYIDQGRFAVCSVSPELFFRRSGDLLVTAPMKGTSARVLGVPDAEAARLLRASAKDVAENVMIVDLLRNDLGRVSVPGTVLVRDLCTVEHLPTLHTMTSTIEARSLPGAGLVDVLGALFPSGSITGAPKASTMAIIAALEDGPRGIYCGAVGVLAPGGDATFNVAIRTAVVDRLRSTVEYGVGGGITYSSDAAAEFAELLTKSRVLDALPGPVGAP